MSQKKDQFILDNSNQNEKSAELKPGNLRTTNPRNETNYAKLLKSTPPGWFEDFVTIFGPHILARMRTDTHGSDGNDGANGQINDEKA